MWSLPSTLTDRILNRSTESVVYSCKVSGLLEKSSMRLPGCLKRSARLLSDLKWIHPSPPRPDLTWTSHSLVSGPGGLLFLGFRQLSLLLPHPGRVDKKCVSRRTPPRICRDVTPCIWDAAEGYLCFLIFFILFDVLSWSSRSRSGIISQMDTSDLLKNMSYQRLPHAQGKGCHCNSTIFTTLQCHARHPPPPPTPSPPPPPPQKKGWWGWRRQLWRIWIGCRLVFCSTLASEQKGFMNDAHDDAQFSRIVLPNSHKDLCHRCSGKDLFSETIQSLCGFPLKM